MRRPLLLSLALVVSVLPAAAQRTAPGRPPIRTTWFVDQGASGDRSGVDFANAFVDLQDALAAARGGDRILVAGGTYRPDEGTLDPNRQFQVRSDVELIGGFAGSAHATPTTYDPDLYETVLSGDLLGDDLASFGNRGDNSAGVVQVGFATTGAVGSIRGVTVRGSEGAPAVYAFEPSVFRRCRFVDNRTGYRGAGLLAVADVHVTRSTFADNRIEVAVQASGGAGMAVSAFVPGTTALVTYTRFERNVVEVVGPGTFEKWGGGLAFFTDDALADRLVVEASTFRENELLGLGPSQGGGLHSDAVCEIERCLFVENEIVEQQGLNNRGGGLSVGPTFVFGAAQQLARVTNCAFVANRLKADLGAASTFLVDMRGGGAYLSGGELQNCLFHANTLRLDNPSGTLGRTVLGGGLYGEEVTIRNTTLTFNRLTTIGTVGQFGDDTGGAFACGSVSTLVNSILWNNFRNGFTDEDAQVYVFGGALSLDYCDVMGFSGALGGVGNVDVDPQFVDQDGADDVLGTFDDDLRLGPTSPCCDAGDNAAVGLDPFDLDGDGDTAEALPLDLDLAPRTVDNALVPDTGAGTSPLVDLGAYERP